MTTLTKVATRAGVSKTTASMILNNRQPDQFSDETRRKVMEIARSLSYAPKLKKPVESSSKTVSSLAFMLSDKLGSGPGGAGYFGSIIDGIHAMARERNLHVNVATNLVTADEQRRFLENLNGEVQGVLAGMPLAADIMAQLQTRQLPVVCVGDVHGTNDACFRIHGDNYQGGRLGVEHLIKLGHKRIVFAGLAGDLEFFRQRLAGYYVAMSDAGLPVDPKWVCRPASAKGVAASLRTAFKPGKNAPTAVFAASSECTQFADSTLRDLGLTIPTQVSLVGYDDWPLFSHTNPPLTVVTASPEQIGRMAVTKLLYLIQNPNVTPHVTFTPTRLIVRQSTAPVAAG